MGQAQDPLEQLDYYSLLQVDQDATPDAVRRAFHEFAARYHPDKFLRSGAEKVHVERAAQIYRRGAEAYKVLTDQRRRRAYDAQLAQGKVRYDANEEPPAPAATGAWPIRVKNPMARPFATKAEQAFKARDWGNAKVNLKMALSKDTGNVQITALLAEVEQKMSIPPQT
ncbi:MAG TPA: DnaJ domain-containing protein [Polyangiales bacterium]|nr:DnaJ domain-containing protein [Polyangiales bacterium]